MSQKHAREDDDDDDDDDEEGGAPKLERRTWDKEKYAQLAREKLKALAESEDGALVDPEDKEIYHEAPAHLPRVPGSERAFLQTREKRIRLEARLGQKNVRLLSSTMGRGPLSLAPVSDRMRA